MQGQENNKKGGGGFHTDEEMPALHTIFHGEVGWWKIYLFLSLSLSLSLTHFFSHSPPPSPLFPLTLPQTPPPAPPTPHLTPPLSSSDWHPSLPSLILSSLFSLLLLSLCTLFSMCHHAAIFTLNLYTELGYSPPWSLMCYQLTMKPTKNQAQQEYDFGGWRRYCVKSKSVHATIFHKMCFDCVVFFFFFLLFFFQSKSTYCIQLSVQIKVASVQKYGVFISLPGYKRHGKNMFLFLFMQQWCKILCIARSWEGHEMKKEKFLYSPFAQVDKKSF